MWSGDPNWPNHIRQTVDDKSRVVALTRQRGRSMNACGNQESICWLVDNAVRGEGPIGGSRTDYLWRNRRRSFSMNLAVTVGQCDVKHKHRRARWGIFMPEGAPWLEIERELGGHRELQVKRQHRRYIRGTPRVRHGSRHRSGRSVHRPVPRLGLCTYRISLLF